MHVRFGEFELNSEAGELVRAGHVVHLQPKVHRLLEHLILERHRIVSHDEVLKSIWPAETVVPAVVTTTVRSLRRALRDESETPQYVRTVHRRGYRFIADVTELQARVTAAPCHWPIVAARHAAFVGRMRELALCRRTVANPGSEIQLTLVHGVPGIGKTSFLHELAYRCGECGVHVVRLDAEYLAPSPDSFARAIGNTGGRSERRERAGATIRLYLIDNYERIAALDAWLREVLLPELPPSTRLVLASRCGPRSRWRSDPGWQRIVQEIELGPLTTEESEALLQARAPTVPAAALGACWSYTKGHPLALALSAESLAGSANLDDLGQRTDVVDALVERFTEGIAEPRHREALEVASLVELTDERFLRAMFEPRSTAGLMDWLSSQSFARRVGGGISLHALAREAVIAQLRWRDPDRLCELIARGMRTLASELGQAVGSDDALRWSRRLQSMVRHHPVMRPFFRDEEAELLELRRATARQIGDVPALIERHEGAESAAIARRWFERQPEQAWVVADDQVTPAGFAQVVLLTDEDRDAASWDPVVGAVFRHADSLGGLDEEEIVTVMRFIADRAGYQAVSPVMQRCHEVANHTHHWYPAGHARVAHSYMVYGQPDVWEPVANFSDFRRARGFEAAVGHREFAFMHHSFRDCPFEAWAARIVHNMTTAMILPP